MKKYWLTNYKKRRRGSADLFRYYQHFSRYPISKNENELRSKMKSNQDPIVILDQDLKTKKQKVLKPLRFQDFYWSEWRDLNSRPLDPQSSALPTALHPDFSLLLSCGSQLVYISMPFIKMQAFFRKFLNFFSGRIFKILLTRTGGYGIINKRLNDGHSRRFMERCPSGWRNRSWKPATWKRPWVRIPLSPPQFYDDLRKYPRGRRGSPAKGVGCLKNAARVQIPPSAPARRKRNCLRRVFSI